MSVIGMIRIKSGVVAAAKTTKSSSSKSSNQAKRSVASQSAKTASQAKKNEVNQAKKNSSQIFKVADTSKVSSVIGTVASFCVNQCIAGLSETKNNQNVQQKSTNSASTKYEKSVSEVGRAVTYVTDAAAIYTSTGQVSNIATPYAIRKKVSDPSENCMSNNRPAVSFKEQEEEKKALKSSKKSGFPISSVSKPIAPKVLVKVKSSGKKKSAKIKIYEPSNSRNGAGAVFYRKRTNPSAAREGASLTVSFIPVAGDVKDIQEVVTGKDLITGKKLTKADRVATVISACLPVVSGSSVRVAKKGAKKVFSKVSTKSDDIAKASKKVCKDVVDKAKSKKTFSELKEKTEQGVRDIQENITKEAERKAKLKTEKVKENAGEVKEKVHSEDGVSSGHNVTNGATRAAKYSSEWGDASLKDAIEKFAPDVEPVVTSKGKVIYNNTETGISVVYDKNGDYFRIEDTTKPRGRNYLDIDGNDMNNEIVDGKIRGRSKSDYQKVTHFKNID